MAAIATASTRRPGVLGVHSLDRFVFTVPELGAAEAFYRAFGLDVRRQGQRLDLHTFGHPHCWGSVFATGSAKKLQYLSLGIYADDASAFRERVVELGIGTEPHPLADRDGIWLRNPDGVAMQLVVADKTSPARKSTPTVPDPVPPGAGAAPGRSRVQPVRPRRLSHVLLFTPDVLRMVAFCRDALGLRLSDHSGDGIAFVHGAHGSDHHLLAFAKSHAPGLHHSSWDVGSADEVGLGSEQMRNAGHARGWGVGRHVLGSNYFYYVKDPWGSFAEYSFDIDFVPHDLDWPAADHPPEDSFYVWGPPPIEEFIENHEPA
ncbi:MAG TPA: VOC family protein [Burkholderiaceae bacterium]|nr:VOC family protein [Burkholderiaceae bacterium]